MNFIKVGDTFINVDRVQFVKPGEGCNKGSLQVVFAGASGYDSPSDSVYFKGEEAEAVENFLNNYSKNVLKEWQHAK